MALTDWAYNILLIRKITKRDLFTIQELTNTNLSFILILNHNNLYYSKNIHQI